MIQGSEKKRKEKEKENLHVVSRSAYPALPPFGWHRSINFLLLLFLQAFTSRDGILA